MQKLTTMSLRCFFFKAQNHNTTSLFLPHCRRLPLSSLPACPSQPCPRFAPTSTPCSARNPAESSRRSSACFGGFDLAEGEMHDAFNAALQRWPVEGLPANPRVWLISTARFKAIDAIRRRARFDASQDYIAAALYGDEPASGTVDDELPDDR